MLPLLVLGSLLAGLRVCAVVRLLRLVLARVLLVGIRLLHLGRVDVSPVVGLGLLLGSLLGLELLLHQSRRLLLVLLELLDVLGVLSVIHVLGVTGVLGHDDVETTGSSGDRCGYPAYELTMCQALLARTECDSHHVVNLLGVLNGK